MSSLLIYLLPLSLSIALLNQFVGLIALQTVPLEQLAVRIGQELVSTETEADRVLLDPRLLSFQGLRLIGRWLHFDLFEVVSELVIRHDKGIGLPSVLDAVRVIVILGWCLDHDSFTGHHVQS